MEIDRLDNYVEGNEIYHIPYSKICSVWTADLNMKGKRIHCLKEIYKNTFMISRQLHI
jgi:hypothetical protein